MALIARKELFRQKYFVRLLFSFGIMAFLIVLCTSLIFSALYIGNVYKQMAGESGNSLERLKTNFDATFRQLLEIDLYLTNVPDVNAFLYSYNGDDYMTLNRADIISRQIKNFNPYLHSLLLYNEATETSIMSGKLNIDKNQFITGTLASPATKSTFNMVFSTLTGNPPTQTLSLLFNDTERKSILRDSGIVMTLDRGELEQKMLTELQGTTVVADSVGKTVFSTSGEYDTSVAGQPFFLFAQGASEPQGSRIMPVDGKNMIVSYTHSGMTGFLIINIRSAESYTSIVNSTLGTLVIISASILVVFLLLSYLMSRNAYTPIKSVIDFFKGSGYNDPNGQPGEISMIQQAFNRALKRIGDLELETVGNNSRLKEDFLRRLLRAGTLSESLQEEARKYSFGVEFKCLAVVSIRIDGYGGIDRNRRYAAETALCRNIPELLGGGFRVETVNMQEGEIALLVNASDSGDGAPLSLRSALDAVRDTARSTLGITLTAGVTEPADGLDACAANYRKALSLVKHRFLLGPDHTIHADMLEEHLLEAAEYPVELEERLMKAIHANKPAEFNESLDSLIGLLKRYPYSKSVSMLFQIITGCIMAMNQTAPLNGSRYFVDLDEFSTMFYSLETLDMAKDFLHSLFRDYQLILDKIMQLKSSKYYNLVEKMREYINKEYKDPNINVESIAAMAGYTSYYFSKIFRDVTGMNVIDYIKHVRISKAKELLHNEDIRINDIPTMIGFVNPSHFYAVFKSDVGLTPSTYRDYVLHRDTP